jgi:ATP-dependent DNA ligase
VVQVEFGEWRPDSHLRHSEFLGLREDKEPSEVLPERWRRFLKRG